LRARGAPKGIQFVDHVEHDDGGAVFDHACPARLRGYRFQAQGPALPLRTLGELDQSQEPAEPGFGADGRGVVLGPRARARVSSPEQLDGPRCVRRPEGGCQR
jgi:hypothetical protein